MVDFNLNSIVESTFSEINEIREKWVQKVEPKEVGKILSVSAGIVRVSGLPNAGYEELLKFPGNLYGIAFNIDENEIGVVLLGENAGLHEGDEVERSCNGHTRRKWSDRSHR
jgi:F-type H+-transporting ATPase subunit alpha